MFLLRRSALRALSKPSGSFVKPRSISTAAPAFTHAQQQWTRTFLQKRLYSDESKPSGSSATTQVPVTESTPSPQTPAEQSSIPASEPTNTNSTPSDPSIVVPIASESAASEQAPAQGATAPRSNVLYIGNLFFEVNEEQLQNVFSKFGPLKNVRIAYDNRGLSRGYGFIEFENHEDAADAIEALNQEVFSGRRMIVQFQKPRSNAGTRDGSGRRVRTPSTPGARNPPSRTLFLGNMSFEMSDKDLNDLFRDVQNVLDVRVAIDRTTGNPRGFAHADFLDVESAVKAKSQLEGKEIYGRKLRLDFGKDTRERRDFVGRRGEKAQE